MTRSVRSVVDDLSEHAIPATATRMRGTVACVAGHGPFDEAVSAMLAQLLEAAGVEVRLITNAATSREAIAALDLRDVSVIAISYLELGGSPARVRYLIKRLRARTKSARVVVGLWSAGEPALSDDAIQHAIGSDRYVGTLAEAVDTIIEEGAAARAKAA